MVRLNRSLFTALVFGLLLLTGCESTETAGSDQAAETQGQAAEPDNAPVLQTDPFRKPGLRGNNRF